MLAPPSSDSHTDDGIHAEHADAHIGDVHRAALGAIASRRLAVEFGHHAVDFHALGDAVSMTPMRGGDPIAGFQCRAHTHGASFLAGVIMHCTHGHARLDEPPQALLELADERQSLIHPEQLLARRQILRESRSATGRIQNGLTLQFPTPQLPFHRPSINTATRA